MIKKGGFAFIAGPCAVESREQIITIAQQVKAAGAAFLRGGAYKPRTSPYDFQGLGEEGLRLLAEARDLTGLPVVTELTEARNIDLFLKYDIDIIQVGARNAQNYELLKELGGINKPVLLKRGLAGTIRELLYSAEYIMARGNGNIILCERGVRTFDSEFTRNTLDLAAVPVLKALTHLPVIVDPSHATGRADLVGPMTLAAVAAGADGILAEVHHSPPDALCDGTQAITPCLFSDIVQKSMMLRGVLYAD